MQLVWSRQGIRDLLLRQVSAFFPLEDEDIAKVDASLDDALNRCETSFSRVRNKYYSEDGVTKFDPLHGCQWAFFQYAMVHSIFKNGGVLCAIKSTLFASLCAALTCFTKWICQIYSPLITRLAQLWDVRLIRITSILAKDARLVTIMAFTPCLGSRFSC